MQLSCRRHPPSQLGVQGMWTSQRWQLTHGPRVLFTITVPPPPPSELVPPEFAEALVRLAAHQYPHASSLSAAVKRLMAEDVLPNAARTDVDAFRAGINSHTVRQGTGRATDQLLLQLARVFKCIPSHGGRDACGHRQPCAR